MVWFTVFIMMRSGMVVFHGLPCGRLSHRKPTSSSSLYPNSLNLWDATGCNFMCFVPCRSIGSLRRLNLRHRREVGQPHTVTGLKRSLATRFPRYRMGTDYNLVEMMSVKIPLILRTGCFATIAQHRKAQTRRPVGRGGAPITRKALRDDGDVSAVVIEQVELQHCEQRRVAQGATDEGEGFHCKCGIKRSPLGRD